MENNNIIDERSVSYRMGWALGKICLFLKDKFLLVWRGVIM